MPALRIKRIDYLRSTRPQLLLLTWPVAPRRGGVIVQLSLQDAPDIVEITSAQRVTLLSDWRWYSGDAHVGHPAMGERVKQ